MKKKEIIAALIMCIAVVAFASAFASSYPDGLEWVAGKLGFESLAAEVGFISTPLADYELAGINSSFFASLFAGLLGIGAVFGGSYLVSWWLKGGRTHKTVE